MQSKVDTRLYKQHYKDLKNKTEKKTLHCCQKFRLQRLLLQHMLKRARFNPAYDWVILFHTDFFNKADT